MKLRNFGISLVAPLALGAATATTAMAGGLNLPGTGPISTARAGAAVASTDDGEAVSINPAGLANVTGTRITLGSSFISHSQSFTRFGTYDAVPGQNVPWAGQAYATVTDESKPDIGFGNFQAVPMLVVTSDFPVKTLREFVDLVKANPNKYNYGSWGVGSGGHLAMEALKMQAGIKLNHVPYKTIPLILNDLIGGQINIGFVDSTTSLVHIRSGKLRPLVCSGTRRGPALPDLPTMTEAGYKFDVDAWFAMFAPAGTPMPIVRRLNEEINRILLLPDMRARFTALNMPEPPVKSVDQFAQTVRDDIVAWGAVIKAADIKPE